MSALLKLDQVSIAYGQTTVVHQLGLQLETGEIGCLLGSSGCGKTSVLRAIAGFEPITSGSITLSGDVISDPKNITPPEQRQIGMVFQDFTLFPHLNVEKNIAFGLRDLPKTEQQKRVKDLLQLIGLDGYAQRFPHELSGGQQQRIALARAIAPRPRLLLLDEPFASLDTDNRRQLAQQVGKILRQENMTALLVTHDQQEAFALADSVGVIKDGKILQWDSPEHLYQQPLSKEVASFIGGGSWLNGTINTNGRADTALGEVDLAPKTDDQHPVQITLLIRPHDLGFDHDSPHIGTVEQITFRGDSFLYHVSYNAQAFEISSTTDIEQAVGATIGIRLRSAKYTYFTQ